MSTMKTWMMIALCVSATVASAHAAAFPAQYENLVVASAHPKVRRSIDETSERPLEPIKLTEMRVRSEVALRYARTAVLTHVHNPDARPQEVTFRMLLPDTAFISGFTMNIDGKSYKAYVQEKQKAKQTYAKAVSQGLGAAHVATQARDSNHFTVSVNVEGNTTAVFDLRYEEFLVRRNGLYSHVINLHPGALVPVLQVAVHIRESQKITTLRVPELRTGNELDTAQQDAQNPKAVIQNGTNDREVTITFTPDLLEQRRLAKIYMDKSKDGTQTALGQFVVEYDVEQSNNGEILVNDGYFVHFLAPTSLPPLSKHIVFVLDTSWSMMGRKIEQMRNAMQSILSELKPNDYFNIVEFTDIVKVHELKEADQSAPARASPENIAKAKTIVSNFDCSGATDIQSALDAAISLIEKGVSQKNDKTDSNSKVTNGTENTKQELEPIIFFLTDGVPVYGESNTDRIISRITEKNKKSGNKKAALYSIAFGEDADREFLRKLSLRNEGFMRHIYEAADAALQLHDFYRQVSSPLLANVRFLYPANQTKEGSVSRSQFRRINAGSEVAVVGRIADDVTEITPRMVGFFGSEEDLGLTRYEVTPKVVVPSTKDEYLPLERLWAYLTIKQLLDKRDAGDDSAEKKALDIALKYEFVTPLTSLVVVKPEESNLVDVESVNSQSNAPEPTTSAPVTQPPQPTYYHYSPPTSSYDLTPSWDDYDYSGGRISSYNIGNGHSNFGRMYSGGMRSSNIGNGRSNFNQIYYGRRRGRGRANFITLSADNNGYSGMNADDDDDYYYGGYGSRHRYSANTVAAPPTTSATTTTTTQATTTVSSGKYHLEGFEWTSSLLNTSSDALVVRGEHGTSIILKLTIDINPPKADGGDSSCSNSTSAVGASEGAGSVCVYLTRCYAARSITADDYQKTYCIVDNRYAGVCCARADVDKNPQ